MFRLLRQILSLTLLFCVLLPAEAVIKRTYPEARRNAGHKPIVLLCYGANYDERAEKFHDTFMHWKHLRDLLSKCVFVEVPLYQYPTEQQKKEMQEIIGPDGLPGGIRCFPCLVITDSKGNARSVIQEPDDMKSVDTALTKLKERVEAFEKQEKLLNKVDSASGQRRYRLLTEAVDVKDMSLPQDAIERGKRRIKRDKVGFEDRMVFNPITYMEHIMPFTPEQAEADTRDMMQNPGYSKTQRQEMLAALGGNLRRDRDKKAEDYEEGYVRMTEEERIKKLRAIYTEMRDLDPQSMYGAYAQGALDRWVIPAEKAMAGEPVPTQEQVSAVAGSENYMEEETGYDADVPPPVLDEPEEDDPEVDDADSREND